jgi:hypothetical protein
MSRLAALDKRIEAFRNAMKTYNDLKWDLHHKRMLIKCDQAKFEQERWCDVIIAQHIINVLPGILPDIAEMISEFASEHDLWDGKLCSVTDTDRVPWYQIRTRCWCERGWFERKPVGVTRIGASMLTLYKTEEDRVILRDKHKQEYIISYVGAQLMKCKPLGCVRFLAYFQWLKRMTPSDEEWTRISRRFSGLKVDDNFEYDHLYIADSDSEE